MKAVYEKPFASVSLFEANSAIAGCWGDMDLAFDCLKGDSTQTDNVMCSSLDFACNRDVGFADMNGLTTTSISDDNITSSTINVSGDTIGRHTTNSSYINITSNSVSVKDEYADSFVGWLYFGADRSGNNIGTSSWSIVNGILTFRISSANYLHEHIAPVFNKNIGTSL